MPAMLSARSLGVELGGRAIVEAIDLEIGPGSAVAVVGPSGAGKAALARALVGLEPALSGSLRFAGVELIGAPREAWR
ncbi:MAG TPA: ATP-binding cassette domain-containing protein, partial [Nannocystis sp.]